VTEEGAKFWVELESRGGSNELECLLECRWCDAVDGPLEWRDLELPMADSFYFELRPTDEESPFFSCGFCFIFLSLSSLVRVVKKRRKLRSLSFLALSESKARCGGERRQPAPLRKGDRRETRNQAGNGKANGRERREKKTEKRKENDKVKERKRLSKTKREETFAHPEPQQLSKKGPEV